MKISRSYKALLARSVFLSPLAALAACGGGGVSSAPPPALAPAPTPTPTPTPSPAPTTTAPASSFVTSEYTRSTGPAQHGAVTAWAGGYSGSGVTIGIVDSGIDSDSPEFAGRISAASRDVAGSRGVDNTDSDHGTNVAMVAAAARDNTGIMGIAYQSQVAMFRADTPGTCATEKADDPKSGCTFADSAIARGISAAAAAGARVINLSLGGGTPGSAVRSAVASAAASGIVVIVSAGNDGDSTEAGIDPNNPDPFATALRAAGNGNVIIAGSVNADNTVSVFSNRAGSEAAFYLMARGHRVCCSYKDGVIEVGTNADGVKVNYVFSGTSFAAPQISGAVALLRQAFPNLTATQVVDLLLKTAKDAGDTGTDAIYGRGILDIAAAFAPQGQTALAGTTTAVPLGDTLGVTSPPMGDAPGTSGSLGTVVLDSYQRAYRMDIPSQLKAAQLQPRLLGALMSDTRQLGFSGQNLSMSFSVDGRQAALRQAVQSPLKLGSRDAEMARVLAARVVARISPKAQIAFSLAQGADGLVMQMQGRQQPAFFVAGAADQDFGFARSNLVGAAARREVGKWGVTLAADQGRVVASAVPDNPASALGRERDARVARFGVTFDRRFGDVATAFGANWVNEERSVLGARFLNGLGGNGADSLFADAGMQWSLANDWQIGAAARAGLTMPRSNALVAGSSRLWTSAWSIDATRFGLFQARDSLSLRLSQPLRVEGGGLNLTLPVDYSYAGQATTFGTVPLSLTPQGRELAAEINWRGSLFDGSAMLGVYHRRNPGHFAAIPSDTGVAASWSRKF